MVKPVRQEVDLDLFDTVRDEVWWVVRRGVHRGVWRGVWREVPWTVWREVREQVGNG